MNPNKQREEAREMRALLKSLLSQLETRTHERDIYMQRAQRARDMIDGLEKELKVTKEELAENERLTLSRDSWKREAEINAWAVDRVVEVEGLLREARVALDDAGSGLEWGAFLSRIDAALGEKP
jgi:hypothetical protein